jgi:predicted nuclease of predicted toxin-antitoxin system
MRFLADGGISPRTVDFLRQMKYDAVHIRDRQLHRATDRLVIDHARAESRVVLTFDLDFGELLALGILDSAPRGCPARARGRVGIRRADGG